MPYAVLLKEAHRLIDELPEEKLVYFVNIIQREEKKTSAAPDDSIIAFVQKYKGSIHRDIDEKAELSTYRNEKYASIDRH